MVPKYLCPQCQNSINIGDDIILVAKTRTGMQGIVFLHTELGNYTSKFSEDFSLVEGNIVTFICPICHGVLTNRKNHNLAHFIFIDSKAQEATIIFSQIYGEKCTFRVVDSHISESFGDDTNKYVDPNSII